MVGALYINGRHDTGRKFHKIALAAFHNYFYRARLSKFSAVPNQLSPMPKPPTHIRLSRLSDPVIVADGTAWFSQKQIAEVFQKAVQTANEHITAVRKAKAGAWRVLRVAQTEGTRCVVRNKLHYRLDFVYAVGLKAREYVITNEILDECRAFGIVTTDLPVIPVKEREFREMVNAAFDGICAFEYQFEVDRYRLDLFCRELCIAVEYDEKHHTKPKNIAADRLRESQITKMLPGVAIVRVAEGDEYGGLNRLIKLVCSRVVRDRLVTSAMPASRRDRRK